MVTTQIPGDREALEFLRERHPELHSVRSVAEIPEDEFVDRYAPELHCDRSQTRRVHQLATDISQRLPLIWANLKAASSPYLKQTLFNNIHPAFLEHQQSMPGYDRLFGGLDFIACDHARSIFGPAAYFVDLMRFVEIHITSRAVAVPPPLQLEDRRPDLNKIKLDRNNTFDLLPYIDVVTSVLEAIIETRENKDAYEVIEASVFPMNLPFNLPLEQTRAYLKRLKTDLQSVYALFSTKSAHHEHLARETLGLSPHEYDLITREITSTEDLEKIYGDHGLAPDFGLTRRALVYLEGDGLPSSVILGLESLVNERFKGSDAKQEFLQRAQEEVGATLDSRHETNILKRADRRLSKVQVFLDQTGLSRGQLNDLIYQDLDRNEINAGLSRLFYINNVEDGLGYLSIEQDPAFERDPTADTEFIVGLSPQKLDRIYRFLKLARRLGWSFADLDWALRSLVAPYEPEASLKFDGVNDFVSCRNVRANLVEDRFTVEAWVNPFRHGINPIVAKGGEGLIHFAFWIDPDGRLAFYNSQVPADDAYVRSQRTIPASTFSHVALTVAGNTVLFHINGVPTTALYSPKLASVQLFQFADQSKPYTGTSLDIGHNLEDCYFEGLIKELRIWKAQRTTEEIADTRYRRPSGRHADLAGYWPMAETHSNQIIDYSVNANHGDPGGPTFTTQPVFLQRDLVLDPLPRLQAYRFNGVDQYLATATFVGNLDSLTIEAWVNVRSKGINPVVACGRVGEIHFQLWIDGSGHLNFGSGDNTAKSRATVKPDLRTHVAAAIDGSQVTFYINGRVGGRGALALAPSASSTLRIGRSVGDDYFSGDINDVRIWRGARDSRLIKDHLDLALLPAQWPSLIGYWKLNILDTVTDAGIERKVALDLSAGRHHAFLGGVLEDYMPTREPVAAASPVATFGTVLDLDGENDVITLRNPENRGLGFFEDWTLAVWFKARDSQRRQVVYTQGDSEAGLNVYVDDGRVRVLAWCADYGPSKVQETALSAAIDADAWHHLTVTSAESGPSHLIDFKAYLDGELLDLELSTVADGTDHQKGLRLSPVGAAYLGGVGRTEGHTRFAGEEIEKLATHHLYYFGGGIADLRLWSSAKTAAAIGKERYVASKPGDEDLVAYLPIDEGDGGTFHDRAEWQQTCMPGAFEGRLSQRNAAMVAADTGFELESIHSHFRGGLDWSQYTYGGRLRFSEAGSGIGVTFYSRCPEGKDRFYLLSRHDQHPTLRLTSHPLALDEQSIAGTDSGYAPLPDTWYRFSVAVSADSRITIKLWPDGEPEPDAAIIDVVDSRPDRPTAGTVGLWAYGPGEKRFDDLQITRDGTTEQLVRESFEAEALGADTAEWVDTGFHPYFDRDADLFVTRQIGNRVLGTDSAAADMHSHYVDGDVDYSIWEHYQCSGRLMISSAGNGIGITFFSGYFEGKNRYYRLRRHSRSPRFGLSSHGAKISEGEGAEIDLDPQVDTWYRFSIEVQHDPDHPRSRRGNGATVIRAKLWEDGTPEPVGYAIEALDYSTPLKFGTVGFWSSRADEPNYFDDLKVVNLGTTQGPSPLLLDESFEGYAENASPPRWRTTGAKNSLGERPGLFKVMTIGPKVYGPRPAFATGSLHSHYQPKGVDVLAWRDYVFTGRLYVEAADSGIGVTFYSRFPAGQNRYYRLRRYRGRPAFHLAPHPSDLRTLKGVKADAAIASEPSTWYRFRVALRTQDETDPRTIIRAKVWTDGQVEPDHYQIEAYDDSAQRPTAGTVGIWGRGSGYVDDLRVAHELLLADDFESYPIGGRPHHWQDTGAESTLEPAADLFGIHDLAGSHVFGTEQTLANCHTHYVGPGMPPAALSDYTYSGRMRMSDPGSGIGITFFSQFPHEAVYYRLGRSPEEGAPFRLSGHPEAPAGRKISRIRKDAAIVADVDVWYRFKVIVKHDARHPRRAEGLTTIRVKLWRDGEPEPQDHQYEAEDYSRPITYGTVGCWTAGNGGKYFDDLSVSVNHVLLETSFEEHAVDEKADGWTDTLARDRFAAANDLFLKEEYNDNVARWQPVNDYPLWAHALALRFDGERQFLAAPCEAELESITISALLRMDARQENPILAAGWSLARRNAYWFGINDNGRLTLVSAGARPQRVSGSKPIVKERLTHVACSIDETSVCFYVNGRPDASNPLSLETPLPGPTAELEIGRNMGGAQFNGLVHFVRLWRSVRTPEQIAAEVYSSQHQILSGENRSELLAYWSFHEPDGHYAADLTSNSMPMRLGGMEGARAPAHIDAHLKPDDGFWRHDRPVVGFAAAEDVIVGDVGSAGPRQRRTVAVWFRVEDASIADRSQVIYHEGNGERGLVIYIHAGQVHFGGYNGAVWEGGWLSTDRIRSRRWHHASLVLDGRPQVRRGALQAYLDGRLLGVEPGSQLDNHHPTFSLGGVRHGAGWNGLERSHAHHLQGQIMSLQIWDTALAPETIRELSLGHPVAPVEPILSWDGDSLLAQAGPERVRTLGSPPIAPWPEPRLDEQALAQMASVAELAARHGLGLDQLTALWAGIRHVGREDRKALFDQIFNVQVDEASRWNYHLDPIRWDLNSNLDRDRAVRSRLLAALRVSDQQLTSLIVILCGQSAGTVVLDRDLLLQLYRLAQLPRVLRLDLVQVVRLLKLMNLRRVRQFSDFRMLSERAAWLTRIGVTVPELDFLEHDISSGRVSVGIGEAAVRELAEELRRQRGDFLATGESFVSDHFNQFQSLRLFELMTGRIIDAQGAVKPEYARSTDIENLNADPEWQADLRLLARQLDWSADLRQSLAALPQWIADIYLTLAELGLGNSFIEQLLHKLRAHDLLRVNGFVPAAVDARTLRAALAADPVLGQVKLPKGVTLESINQRLEHWRARQQAFIAEMPAALIANELADTEGVVLGTATGGFAWSVAGSALTTSELAGLREVLNQRKGFQDHIGARLLSLRSAYDSVMRESLATLWEADAAVTQVVIDHLATLLPPTRLLELMLNVEAGRPVPGELAGFDTPGGPVSSGYLYQFGKILYLVSKFELAAEETRALLADPGVFGVKNAMNPNLAALDLLHSYAQIRAAFPAGGGKLLALLELPSAGRDATLDSIAAFTGWDKQQLAALARHFSLAEPNRLPALKTLKAAFDLAQSVGVDIHSLVRLAATEQLDLPFYRQQAAVLLNAIKARYDETDWPSCYRPIHDELSVKQRDALLGRVMLDAGPTVHGQGDANLLSEYLLMDVQTGSEVDTSYIQQAIASVQLYVQRCLMNLEFGIEPEWVPKDQWEWMKNYRVWEANRKVFLYPENYVEPELRDTKTALFTELEQELMQSDINQDSVTRAYVNYLDRFAELANLKIVGGYRHRDGSTLDTLYLVGRTDTQPNQYYYREYLVDQRWMPWQKIDLNINADHASPVHAFNRLFLFWAEFTKLTKSVERRLSTQIRSLLDPVHLFWRFLVPQFLSEATRNSLDAALQAELSPEEMQNLKDGNWFIDMHGYLYSRKTDSRVQVNVDVYKPVLKFSYLNFGQTWVQPQVYRELDRELREHEYLRHEWQRVYVQRLTEFRESGSQPEQPEQEENARVLEVDENTRILERLQLANTGALTWALWVHFVNRTTPQRERGDINVQTVTLFSYDDRVSLTATNRVTEIAGIAEARAALQPARDAAEKAQESADAAQAAAENDNKDQAAVTAAKIATAAADAAKLAAQAAAATPAVAKHVQATADAARSAAQATRDAAKAGRGSDGAKRAVSAAEAAAAAARQASTRAQETYQALNKWESTSLDLTLKLDKKTVSVVLAYRWHHVAVTLSHARGNYALQLYQDGVEVGTATSRAIALSGHGMHRIGMLASNQPDAFGVQLSDFRLWDHIQDAASLEKTRLVRRTGLEKGLVYYQALNDVLPGALMRLAQSSLTFTQPQATVKRIRELQRERILVFYGDEVGSMRSDLSEDRDVKVSVDPQRFPKVVTYDLDLSLSKLHVALTNGLSLNDYAAGDESTLSRFTPAAWQNLLTLFNDGRNRRHSWYGFWSGLIQNWLDNADSQFNNRNHLLNNVSRFATSLMDVGNQPGWYLLSTDDEQFLIRAEIGELPTTGERLQISYGSRSAETDVQPVSIFFDFATPFPLQGRLHDGSLGGTANDATEFRSPPFTYRFERISTAAVRDLSLRFFRGGIDDLLSLEAQQARENDFGDYEHNPDGLVVPPASYAGKVETLDLDGAYGLYYREIFFHIPFLIANRLNANQNFAEAQKWYHFLFDPTAQESGGAPAGSSKDRYWRFLPFRQFSQTETLADIFTGKYSQEAISEYLEDPLDPHAIARVRVFAYQKSIVMKYIDNLLDWGDYLFGQDTRESINEATQLYILAFNLLGPRPKAKTVRDFREVGDLDSIRERHAPLPHFVTELQPKKVGGAATTLTDDLVTTFGVPENADFVGYWDRVEDRLYKIRHSLNIEGTFRQLALFEPPLDVRALVGSVAGSGGIGSALADLSVPVPHYRYAFLLGRAREMVEHVTGLGSALLSAIESRDAERLAMLQHSHEKVILDLSTAIKSHEVDDAVGAIAALTTSKQSIRNRIDHYTTLIDNGISGEETAELALMGTAQGVKTTAGIFKIISAATAAVPEFSAGGAGLASPVVITSTGGSKISSGFEYAGDALALVAEVMNTVATMVAKMGDYKRRENGWRLELQTAEYDLRAIEQEIELAQIKQKMAQRALEIHQTSIRQHQEIETFHRRKFSNADLYGWMANRLSGLYFQAYKLAYDMAKSAEKAMQYELPSTETFINFGHWDSLRKGLLAGESLQLELSRMEKTHLDQDSRFLEIEKSISMKETLPGSLLLLAASGSCEFQLGELLFDRDYPGHYFRVLKTVAITIKVPAKPYQTIKATLTQIGSKALLKPNADAVRYLLGDAGVDQPAANILRTNWRANQQIAISKADEDLGMFSLSFFFDDRYFPFEGTGAVSMWRLEMPAENNPDIDFDSIEDVIIHLRYTAKSDRGTFRDQVGAILKQFV